MKKHRSEQNRILAAMLMAFLVTGGSFAPSFGRNLIKNFQIESAVYQECLKADQLISAGQYSQAKDVLVRAAAFDPTSYSVTIHKQLADCYEQMKNVDAAVAELKKTMSFDPSRTETLYNIGLLYYRNKKYDAAVDYLNKYISATTNPHDRSDAQKLVREVVAFSYLKKSEAAVDKDNYVQARKFLEKAATYDPTPYTGAIHSSLCYVLHYAGAPEQAIAEGKLALKSEPDDYHTMHSLAVAYADACKFDDAIMWIDRSAAGETDLSRRQLLLESKQGFLDDRKQFNNPNNLTPDYLAVMRGNESPNRWPRKKLPIKVAILPGTGVRGYQSSYPNLVKQALDSWCSGSGSKLDYKIVSDRSKADIEVIWTASPLEAGSSHANTLVCGLTSCECSETGALSHAKVQISTVDPFHPDEAEKEGECAHTVLHEFGHALGLGHSKLIKDVMYFRSDLRQKGLSNRDKATMAHLYAQYPSLQFTPKSTSTAPPVYLPPPSFIPPEPPDTSKLAPPMFMPPPITDDEKLTPPMFPPPPIGAPEKKKSVTPDVAPPMFTPPPLSNSSKVKKKPEPTSNPPFFTPPPAK